MTPRVEWGNLLPGEVRAVVEPLLARWLAVAPTWCHVLAVHWDDARADDDAARTSATMESRPEYREAVLTISNAFLSETPESRERTVRHELAHLPTAGMDDVFARLLRQFRKTNPTLHADFAEQWRQALEAATCDIGESYVHAADPPMP